MQISAAKEEGGAPKGILGTLLAMKKMLAYALSKIFDNDKNVKMHFTGVSEQQGRFARRIVAREDSVRSTHSQCDDDEDEDDHDDDDDGHGNDDDDDSHMINTCWKMVMTMICI